METATVAVFCASGERERDAGEWRYDDYCSLWQMKFNGLEDMADDIVHPFGEWLEMC